MILECDWCEGQIDADDHQFILDSEEGGCSEYVCRKCRGGMSAEDQAALRKIRY